MNLHSFPRGFEVSEKLAISWLEWQGFAVTIAVLEYSELVRYSPNMRVRVIFPPTFIENLIALDAEFRLRQCGASDEGTSTT